jgi:hypothetical protein
MVLLSYTTIIQNVGGGHLGSQRKPTELAVWVFRSHHLSPCRQGRVPEESHMSLVPFASRWNKVDRIDSDSLEASTILTRRIQLVSKWPFCVDDFNAFRDFL